MLILQFLPDQPSSQSQSYLAMPSCIKMLIINSEFNTQMRIIIELYILNLQLSINCY